MKLGKTHIQINTITPKAVDILCTKHTSNTFIKHDMHMNIKEKITNESEENQNKQPQF